MVAVITGVSVIFGSSTVGSYCTIIKSAPPLLYSVKDPLFLTLTHTLTLPLFRVFPTPVIRTFFLPLRSSIIAPSFPPYSACAGRPVLVPLPSSVMKQASHFASASRPHLPSAPPAQLLPLPVRRLYAPCPSSPPLSDVSLSPVSFAVSFLVLSPLRPTSFGLGHRHAPSQTGRAVRGL